MAMPGPSAVAPALNSALPAVPVICPPGEDIFWRLVVHGEVA